MTYILNRYFESLLVGQTDSPAQGRTGANSALDNVPRFFSELRVQRCVHL